MQYFQFRKTESTPLNLNRKYLNFVQIYTMISNFQVFESWVKINPFSVTFSDISAQENVEKSMTLEPRVEVLIILYCCMIFCNFLAAIVKDRISFKYGTLLIMAAPLFSAAKCCTSQIFLLAAVIDTGKKLYSPVGLVAHNFH